MINAINSKNKLHHKCGYSLRIKPTSKKWQLYELCPLIMALIPIMLLNLSETLFIYFKFLSNTININTSCDINM